MGAYQDLKHAYLKSVTGESGSVKELENKFLQTVTGETGPTQDLWQSYWNDRGVARGPYNDRAREWLESVGIPLGSVQGMWKQFWDYQYVFAGDMQSGITPQHSTSSDLNPSFTRATAKGGENEHGKHFQALSGEAITQGARRARNLVTASEDLTNSVYTYTAGASASSATVLSTDGTADGRVQQSVTITDDGSGAGGRAFTFSVEIALLTGTISSNSALQLFVGGDAIDAAANSKDIGSSVTSTPQRFSLTVFTDAAGTTVNPQVRWDDAGTLEVTKWQLEEVTGNLTHAPSEYVSTGVGTGSELIANGSNPTDTTGWTPNASGTISATGGEFLVTRVSSSADYSSYAFSTVVGKDYVITDTMRRGTTTNAFFSVGTSPGAADNVGVTATTSTTNETKTVSFTATATTTYITVNASSNGTHYHNLVSSKVADHGAGRDGVKYFPYHNGNTAERRKFLDLDGTGDSAQTPDPGPVTGELEVIGYCRPDALTGSTQTLVGQWESTASQESWIVQINSSGQFLLATSNDGSATVGSNTGTALTSRFSNGDAFWWKLTWSAATDTMRAYTSTDPLETGYDSVIFSQLGTDTAHTDSALFDSSESINIGSQSDGVSQMFSGAIFKTRVRNDSTVLAEFNAEDHTGGSTLTSSTTGEVWTFNGDAFIDNEETGVVTENTGPAINSANSQWVNLLGDTDGYPTTPSSGASQIGDKITLIANAALDDWSRSSDDQAFVAKYFQSGNQRSYLFRVNTSGVLEVFTSDDGIATTSANSTTAVPFANGEAGWVRVTVDPTAQTVDFYISFDPIGTALDSVNWIQWGPQDSISQTSIHEGTAVVSIGGWDSTGDLAEGKIFRAAIISGTDATATPAVDFNPNDYEAGSTFEASNPASTNVVVNGNFANGTSDWIEQDSDITLSASNNEMTVTSTGAFKDAYQAFDTDIGKDYLFVGEMSQGTAGALVEIRDGIPGTSYGNVSVTSGGFATKTFRFTATTAQATINLQVQDAGGGTALFRNLSIVRVPDVWTLNGNAKVFSPKAHVVDMPGSSGDYISTPDSAANSVTGSLCIAFIGSVDDWSVAETLVGKWTNTGNQRSYLFQTDGSGGLILHLSNDGSATDNRSSSALGFSDASLHGVLAVYDNSADTVDFYTANESECWKPWNQIVWTNLDTGLEITVTGVYDGTSTLEIGANAGGTNGPMSGKAARAAVWSGTDFTATPVADWDARIHAPGVATATGPDGATYTINGNCEVETNIASPWDEDGPVGVSVHEARTNEALYSNDLSDAAWSNASSVDVQNYAIAPDGTKTANRLIDDSSTGTGNPRIQQPITVTSGQDQVWYAIMKADQLDWGYLRADNFDASVFAYFDLANGRVGTTSGLVDQGIKALVDGWYLCWIVFNSTTDVSGNCWIYVAEADNDITVDLDGTSSILVWHAQSEEGSFPTPPIPTGASAVARNADVLTYTSPIASGPLTMTAEVTQEAASSSSDRAFAIVHDGSSSNRHYIFDSQTNYRYFVQATSGQMDQSSSEEVLLGVPTTVTLAVGENDGEGYVNGRSVVTDSSITLPSGLTTINVGSNEADGSQLNGYIRNLSLYSKRLTDAQVASL